MPKSSAAKVKALVFLGTQKGVFTLTSDRRREHWSLGGPHLVGGEAYHVAYDPRSGGALMAAVNFAIWGPQLHLSRDLGQTWTLCAGQPGFPKESGSTVKRFWHIEPGRADEPGVWYVGAEPASLFKTEDDGLTWTEISSLSHHPTRERWQPGFGGLCLHSIVLHPAHKDRMWVGISAVGVLGTQDGGRSWTPMNKGVRADFLPDKHPEIGQCPHKVLSHPAVPERLYQQNHCGVYRSDDGGDRWTDISDGLPSRFGFVLGLHHHDPDTIYVMPEDRAVADQVGGMKRYVTDARLRIYRSRDAGHNWEPLTEGLPQKDAFFHSLREGMATDVLDPCGVYIGTKTGQVFYSRDEGDHWELLREYLPPIVSVGAAVIS